ncbi:unnamed protein product [Lampetra fluviatilis]
MPSITLPGAEGPATLRGSELRQSLAGNTHTHVRDTKIFPGVGVGSVRGFMERRRRGKRRRKIEGQAMRCHGEQKDAFRGAVSADTFSEEVLTSSEPRASPAAASSSSILSTSSLSRFSSEASADFR